MFYEVAINRKPLTGSLPIKKILNYILAFILLLNFTFCTRQRKFKDGKVVVTYWEKWTGFEKDAMQKTVDKFNKSQDKIYVDMLTISGIDRKVIVATAGGVPPDIAGVWTSTLPILADKGAIIDLTEYFQKAGISQENFIPFVWKVMSHRERVWGMITTPASLALHWNKRMFKEGGFDPNVPPKTIEELNYYSDRLTIFEDTKTRKKHSYYELVKRFGNEEKATKHIEENKLSMIQAGFLPSEPGWWSWSWGYFFGGKIYEEPDKITANSKENIEAYKWVQSFMRKYGEYNVKKFSSGFGQFSSPQNAFLSAKIAMVIQGVWMYNFIEKYSPGMQWDAAPFPTITKKMYGITLVAGDALVIPKGALNPDAAFEFIKFLAKPENMEILCGEQRKFSPLAEVTSAFHKNHKHPNIKIFRKMAESEYTFFVPRVGIWNEYSRDIEEAFSRIWLQLEDPGKVLNEITSRNQRVLDLELELLRKRGKI